MSEICESSKVYNSTTQLGDDKSIATTEDYYVLGGVADVR